MKITFISNSTFSVTTTNITTYLSYFRLCRPIYKEFDEWPEISLEPDPPKEKKKETPEKITNPNQNTKDTAIPK